MAGKGARAFHSPIGNKSESKYDALKDIQVPIPLSPEDEAMFSNIEYANVNANNLVNNSANVSHSTSENNVQSTGAVVIKRSPKKEEPKRQTYWLKPSTIKKLSDTAKNANMGISELLQVLLDDALSKIEIK